MPKDAARNVSPQLALALEATEEAWMHLEAEFGMLSEKELAEVVGTADEGFAPAQRAAGSLLAIARHGAHRYPGFQIDRDKHTIRPVISELLQVAEDAGRSEASLALWLVTGTGYLDGDRPVDHLSDEARVVDAARQSFNVVW